MLGANARRQKILAVMNVRRHDTFDNLANEFGVSKRTIRYDIEYLSVGYPIYTVSGRYGGGVYIMDGCQADKKYLSIEQSDLLSNLSSKLSDKDKTVMESILKEFSIPRNGGKAS